MWKKLHRSRDTGPEDDVAGVPPGWQKGPDLPHDTSRQLPRLPVPMNHDSSSQSRITSSIYSRASTVVPNTPKNGHHTQYADVSPPVSPLQAPQNAGYDSPDISPIDETPPSFEQFYEAKVRKAPASALPVLKKPIAPGQAGIGTRGRIAPPVDPPGKRPDVSPSTMWDDFSGEPTTDEKGKPPLATPGKSPLLAGKPSTQKSQFSFLDKGRALNKAGKKLLESRRNHNSDDPAVLPPHREPWRGLSGRTTIVEPVATDKSARAHPLTVTPRGDSLPRHLQTSPESSATDARGRGKRTIIPVPPKDNMRNISSGPDRNKPLPRKHSEERQGPAVETFISNFPDFSLDQQPATSRFSTTTYATTEAGSPPPSPKETTADDAPPLPALPSETTSRVRAAVRKPLASEVTNVKVLPRSPEENGAANRIESLKAKLNDLSRRRGNIDTIINELTQVVQPSSIAYDLATRGEVKKTVESLNKELAEIKKEEYELGMKLMRAYKKQDSEDYYGETSAIWIKRVAS